MRDVAEFYVGYLRMPRGLAGFLRRLVPALVGTAMLLAWQLSGSQSDPGDGVWHAEADELVGRIAATPYPRVVVASSRPGGSVESVLLVSEGKHGAGERVAALDGRVARVRGTILERDGVRLLELADGEPAVRVHSVAAVGGVPQAEASATGTGGSAAVVTLRGEIIDPKCYSGAMKPGEGRAHKECATLCIAGGIPPMFVTLDAAGRRQYFLLTDPGGRGLSGDVLREHVLPFVADAVELSGRIERCDGLRLLRLELTSVRRL